SNPITNLSIGSYYVTVSDANGCTAIATATITEPSPTVITVTLSTTDVGCYGDNSGTVAIDTVTGGTLPYSYEWSNGVTADSFITNLTAGAYTVTVTDANNYTATAWVAVSQPDSAWISVAVVRNVTTNGGSDGYIILDVWNTHPSNYVWSNPNINNATFSMADWIDAEQISYYYDGVPAGTYSVTVTYDAGCTMSATVVVTEPAALNC